MIFWGTCCSGGFDKMMPIVYLQRVHVQTKNSWHAFHYNINSLFRCQIWLESINCGIFVNSLTQNSGLVDLYIPGVSPLGLVNFRKELGLNCFSNYGAHHSVGMVTYCVGNFGQWAGWIYWVGKLLLGGLFTSLSHGTSFTNQIWN